MKNHQPSDRASSENIWKEGVRINSRFPKHASSDRKRSPEELHGSLDRDCERDAVETEESSYSSPVGVPNLNKVVRRTRYSHADNSAETTTNIAYLTETELGKTNPEDGSITPTVTKKITKIVS